MNVVVSPAWLREHLDDPEVRVVDCRFVLGTPGAGHEGYLKGHVAGAGFLDLDKDLSGPVGDGRDGRHPLPAADDFAAAIRREGISRGTTVVAYDDDGRSGGAARLWWLLRHFGHDQAAVLEGGFAAWTGPVRSGEEDIAAGDWAPGAPRDGDVADVRDVATRLRMPGHVLVDARAPERFRGEVEPIDPVPGHIPGAVNAPFAAPVPEELVTTDDEIVVYCGSGVTSCVVLLDLAAQGRDDAKLYAGSYSEWSTRHLPVERG